jgi:SulP family sulfate permease
LVLFTLLFLTPLFHYLPNAVLAAVVLVAVGGLVDVRTARRLFRVKGVDGLVLVVTFVATLAMGAERGVLAGVGISLALFLWRSAHPHSAELGYLEDDGVFRDVARYPTARTWPQALILRVDASLYFANMGFLEDRLRGLVHDRPALRWVVLDMEGVNDVDAGAIETLARLREQYRERGIRFVFASVKGPVRDLLSRAGWESEGAEGYGHLSVQHALRTIGLLPAHP